MIVPRGSAEAQPLPTRLSTLDGWRAIAIIGVLIDHLALAAPANRWTFYFEYGTRGVDLFFGISGMLICYRLLLEDQRQRISIKGFYLRRAARILPVWISYLVILAIATKVSWPYWWSCVLFYRNYLPSWDWNTAHFWSLAVEEHFYLFMPILFLIAGRKRQWAFLSVVGAISLWREIDFHLQLTSAPEMRHRSDYRMDALMWGCIAALALVRRRALLKRVLNPAWALPVAILAFGLAEFVPKPERFFLQAPLPPVMLLSTVLYPGSLPGRILNWKPLAAIGAASYGLYVWQEVFLTSAGNLAWVQRFPWNLAALAAIVTVSYHYMELPINSWARRISQERYAPRPVPRTVAAGSSR